MAGRIIFVSGTDTDIGKTFVASSVADALAHAGVKLLVCKPVETGCAQGQNGKLLPGDAARLQEASGGHQSLDEVGPLRFSMPLAPSIAAAIAGDPIDLEYLKQHIALLASRAEIVLIEGAGGLLVPLRKGYRMLDLISECGAEVLFVVGSRLGAINHALLSFEVLRGRGVPVLGYVLNDLFANEKTKADPYFGAALASNRRAIREEAETYGVSEVCYLPYLENEFPAEQTRVLMAGLVGTLTEARQ